MTCCSCGYPQRIANAHMHGCMYTHTQRYTCIFTLTLTHTYDKKEEEDELVNKNRGVNGVGKDIGDSIRGMNVNKCE